MTASDHDIVVLRADDLKLLLREHRFEIVETLLRELKSPVANVSEPAQEDGSKLVSNEEIWRSIGVCRAKWFRILKKYPALSELKRGRLWPLDEVKRAVAALK